MDKPWRNNNYPAGTQFLYPQYTGEKGWWSCTYIPDIVYAERDGMRLDIQLLLPQGLADAPLIVFIQGSGWGPQDVYTAIPNLAFIASQGFAIASVRFRDTSVAVFPAHLEDTKSAIRFLRANAGKYGYSAVKIGIWGSSSGGHTAAMVGLTPGLFDNGEYPGYSDAVLAVADFFGPSDLLRMNDFPGMDHDAPGSPESALMGHPLQSDPAAADAASPICYVKENPAIPPFLIIHGDTDMKVNFDQSARLYEALRAQGADAILYAVKNGDHGYSCPQTMQLVADFMRTYLRAPQDQSDLW